MASASETEMRAASVLQPSVAADTAQVLDARRRASPLTAGSNPLALKSSVTGGPDPPELLDTDSDVEDGSDVEVSVFGPVDDIPVVTVSLAVSAVVDEVTPLPSSAHKPALHVSPASH